MDDELLEDDMDLLEENEREKKRFTKLKRSNPPIIKIGPGMLLMTRRRTSSARKN